MGGHSINNITITAEYLPGILNIIADYQSRHTRDSSEWKLSPMTLTQHLPNNRVSPNIFICKSPVVSGTKVLLLETRSIQSGSGCHATSWSYNQTLYAFPPIPLIHRVLKKLQHEKVKSLILIAPTWQSQRVPRASETFHSKTSLAEKSCRLIKKSSRNAPSSDTKQNNVPGGLVGLRSRLEKEGISERAAQLITA